MNHVATGVNDGVNFITEAGKIGGKNGRSDAVLGSHVSTQKVDFIIILRDSLHELTRD